MDDPVSSLDESGLGLVVSLRQRQVFPGVHMLLNVFALIGSYHAKDYTQQDLFHPLRIH